MLICANSNPTSIAMLCTHAHLPFLRLHIQQNKAVHNRLSRSLFPQQEAVRDTTTWQALSFSMASISLKYGKNQPLVWQALFFSMTSTILWYGKHHPLVWRALSFSMASIILQYCKHNPLVSQALSFSMASIILYHSLANLAGCFPLSHSATCLHVLNAALATPCTGTEMILHRVDPHCLHLYSVDAWSSTPDVDNVTLNHQRFGNKKRKECY